MVVPQRAQNRLFLTENPWKSLNILLKLMIWVPPSWETSIYRIYIYIYLHYTLQAVISWNHSNWAFPELQEPSFLLFRRQRMDPWGYPPSTAACFRMDASCDFPSLSNSTGILQVSPSSPSAAVKRPKGANSGEIDGNLLDGIWRTNYLTFFPGLVWGKWTDSN